MSTQNRTLMIATALIGLWVTQTAMAESTTTVSVAANGDYAYQFSDQDLLGTTLSEVGDLYRGRPKYARVLLLRPRTTLVSEILKSAEEL